MPYDAQNTLTAPARAYPQLWRLAIGLLFGFAIYMISLLAYGAVIGHFMGFTWLAQAFETGTRTTVLQMYFVLGSFAFMAAGAMAATAVHHRGLRSLVGGYTRTT
ncbi:MAG: CPBP family intramembrane glutamate endopeptidase, partial [Pseudomonadota bacterium]